MVPCIGLGKESCAEPGLPDLELCEAGFGDVAVDAATTIVIGAGGFGVVVVDVYLPLNAVADAKHAVGAVDDDNVMVHNGVGGQIVAPHIAGRGKLYDISEVLQVGACLGIDDGAAKGEIIVVVASHKAQE